MIHIMYIPLNTKVYIIFRNGTPIAVAVYTYLMVSLVSKKNVIIRWSVFRLNYFSMLLYTTKQISNMVSGVKT